MKGMGHREQEGKLSPNEDGTFPVEPGSAGIPIGKETYVAGGGSVSNDPAGECRPPETTHRGRGGIEERYRQARGGFERGFAAKRAAAADDWGRARTFERAEPNYRAGFLAGNDLRYEGQTFESIEPELRREYESSTAASEVADAPARRGSDLWERLRDEIHAGFRAAREVPHEPHRD